MFTPIVLFAVLLVAAMADSGDGSSSADTSGDVPGYYEIVEPDGTIRRVAYTVNDMVPPQQRRARRLPQLIANRLFKNER